MKITKTAVLFYIALIFAIWFAFAAMVWVYFAALIIAYPFGILSFIIWKLSLQKVNDKRSKIIPILLTAGIVFSVVVLICPLIWN